MPISEDEYDNRSVGEATSTMSKAELRKTHKPIMEKRRRARINQCLNEIKALILEAMKKDPARHSKLEKADILEMAVKHLQNVQRQQLAMAMAGDSTVLRKFKTGFNECAREVSNYITQIDEQESGLKDKVSTHLNKCINGIEQIAQFNFPGLGAIPFMSNTFGSTTKTSDSSGDQNNNPRVQIPQGIQLIPSRLPSGEIAFLVPNSSNLPCFSNITETKLSQICKDMPKSQRSSAFVTVIPSSSANQDSLNVVKPLSPPLSPNSNNSQDDVILVSQSFARSPSPKGFRPVNSSLQRSYQSAFVSTANLGNRLQNIDRNSSELKNIRYPIHPKKTADALCIITNQSERFKIAQIPEETANCDENFQQGVKRKYIDILDHQGLLTVASDDFLYPNKILKTSRESYAAGYRNESSASQEQFDEDTNQPSTSSEHAPKDNMDLGNDMWRPW